MCVYITDNDILNSCIHFIFHINRIKYYRAVVIRTFFAVISYIFTQNHLFGAALIFS